MNIMISYNWLKEYLNTDLSVEEFAKKTTNAGNGVEQIISLKERYKGVVVGELLSIEKHPDADKLSVAKVDIGKKAPLNLIFGSMVEMQVGMKVPVAVAPCELPGNVKIEKRKMRGVVSEGMLCLDQELGFLKSGVSIRFFDADMKNGTPLVEALDMDDYLLDIEVTTNRPDAKSVIGQAREGAVVTGDEFAWKPKMPQAPTNPTIDLSVRVEDAELCPRYQAVVVENVKIGPSPWWVQKKLLLAGHRPINNLVDITNLILHEYGQPLHTFDADKLSDRTLIVRKAKQGEKIVALDEVEYELDDSMLVIADSKKPVAVAGVMGGLHSGTTEQTTRVVIEAATFDPVSVRRTARKLNLYSDSQQLFEKGLSTEATSPALARAIELIGELAGGTVASKIYSARPSAYKPLSFSFDPARANKLIGVDIPEAEQMETLTRLGFTSEKQGDTYNVTVPYWRDHDIEHSVDFIEEIARVYGYDRVPSQLPEDELPEIRQDQTLVWQRRAKELLRGLGFTEAYSYAFVSEAQLNKFDLTAEDAIHLQNPLSEDQAYMRPSLLPSMLTAFEENQRRADQIHLFEIAPVYLPPEGKELPKQPLMLLAGVLCKKGAEGFFTLKGVIERLAFELGWKQLSFVEGAKNDRWHATRSAEIQLDGNTIGYIGQMNTKMTQSFGIESDVVMCELSFDEVVNYSTQIKSYDPIPIYQDVKRDVAAIVDERVTYVSIQDALTKASDLLHHVELFDVYRGKGIEDGKKSIALHLSFRADRTLASEEVDAELSTLRAVLEKEFGAIMRS